MRSGSYNVAGDFESARSQMSPEIKLHIVRCCYLVMISDGQIDEREMKRLAELADVLGVPDEIAAQVIEATKQQLSTPQPAHATSEQ